MALTVRELLEALRDASPDMLVILARDEEGNGYSPLAGIDTHSLYAATTSAYGDIHLDALTPELEDQGYSEEDVGGPDDAPCVVLWPTA